MTYNVGLGNKLKGVRQVLLHEKGLGKLVEAGLGLGDAGGRVEGHARRRRDDGLAGGEDAGRRVGPAGRRDGDEGRGRREEEE